MTDFKERYKALLANYAETFALLAVVGITAYFIPVSLKDNKWALLISVFLPSWATLSTLVWEIQSFDGKTTPEILNKWVLRGCYMSGFALFILTMK